MYDVILSGPISGRGDYKLRFAQAVVRVHGVRPEARIWNPAELDADREYIWYMRQCVGVVMDGALTGCVMVCLRDWHTSKGSRAEVMLARALGMKTVDLERYGK